MQPNDPPLLVASTDQLGLRWTEAPKRTQWGAGMMEALVALGKDSTLRLYAEADALHFVEPTLRGGGQVPDMAAAADVMACRLGQAHQELRETKAEIERLRAENAKTLDGVRILSGMFSRNVMAMQAALIDKVLRGPHEGWAWIINTLEGPGLLPDLDDARKAGGAQAWFDAELAAEEARVAGLGA